MSNPTNNESANSGAPPDASHTEKTSAVGKNKRKSRVPRPDIARHPRKVKFSDRSLAIIQHQKAIAPHQSSGNQDITISGIIARALKLLESQSTAAPTLRFALLDGGELAHILAALDECWATLRSFRKDALHPDTIKSVGAKSIAALVKKAEAALDACIQQNARIARMTHTVRSLTAEDHLALVEIISDLSAQAASPKTPETLRRNLTVAAKLLKTFILP